MSAQAVFLKKLGWYEYYLSVLLVQRCLEKVQYADFLPSWCFIRYAVYIMYLVCVNVIIQYNTCII